MTSKDLRSDYCNVASMRTTCIVYKKPCSQWRALAVTVLLISLPGILFCQYSQPVSPERSQGINVPEVMMTTAPEVPITAYGTEDGLPLSSFYTAMKDRHGNLWFGTFGGGVSKFDGKSFQNFNTSHGLAHNVVSTILEDRYGDIWFGTLGGGVSQFDGISFRTFTTKDGLAQNMIRHIFQDSKGRIWFATMESGVTQYDGKNFTTFTAQDGLVNDRTWFIAEDKNGLIYIATDLGVSVFDGKQFTTMPGLRQLSVRCILPDPDGSIWFGTIGRGLFRAIGNEVTRFAKRDGLSDNSIFTIVRDRFGTLWFGTEMGGVTAFDGTNFTAVTMQQGLTHNNVRAIVEDNYGNLWFATYGGGINRYDGDQVAYYGRAQGLPVFQIKDTMEDEEGNLWFASYEAGVSKFDGKHIYHFNQRSGLRTNSLRAIIEDRKKSIWLGTNDEGLSKLTGSTFKNYDKESGLPNNTVVSLLEDSSDKIWIGTDGGLAMFDGKQFKTMTTEHGLPHNSVWEILQDHEGKLWFGTFGGGIASYDGNTFKTYNETHGLGTNTVFSMLEDKKGNIWVGGTNGGLSRFDGKTFFTLKRRDGIPDETVYDIVETENGELWIGTNLGLAKLSFVGKDGQEINAGAVAADNISLKEKFSVRWQVYNVSTGFPIKDINSGSMIVKRKDFPGSTHGKGWIWAGTGDNKLIRFDPSLRRRNENPPAVSLKNLTLNDQQVCWYSIQSKELDSMATVQQETVVYGHTLSQAARDTLKAVYGSVAITGLTPFANLPTGLEIPHTISRITFDYNAIATSNYDLVNYQFKLEGQDDDWGPTVKNTQASYSNLWEGNYIFKVRAQFANGVWGEPVSYRFTVTPPWWRERWMFGIYVFGLGGGVIAFIKARERKLRNEKHRLEKLVNQRIADVVLQTKEAEEQRQEAQRQKLEAERQRLLVEEKNEQIVKQLAQAEASLSNLTLQMIQRFHAFNELEQELKKLSVEGDSHSYSRAFSLIGTTRSLEKEWEHFDFYFSRVHRHFNTWLQENLQLSPYERRMCALIKMGFENREIAMLLNIETSSVKMAKYRIKKKLQIDEKVDLQTYFESQNSHELGWR
ncbi:MAG TPA: two-component regulator propeller domain-containing protein [Chryseosolibacter sp.]